MNILKVVLNLKLMSALIMISIACSSTLSVAGEEKGHKLKKEKEYSEEDIMREISFLAKKLLDMSGEKSLTISSPAVVKPFMGVCSMIDAEGVRLTCITPESQADKNGLKTGDLVVSINGKSMKESEQKGKHSYWGVVKAMQTGDVLNMNVVRAGDPIEVDVTVGSLSHPAYKCEINQ